jgi:hypothetical protein
MARPRKDHAQSIPEAFAPIIVAADAPEVAAEYTGYSGAKDPTTLDASDLNYTHKDSPAHLAWLKSKGLLKGL